MEKNQIKIPDNLSGLLHPYNESFLADDSLTDGDVLLLSLFLIENNSGKAGAKYSELREVFLNLGRKENSYLVCIHRAKKHNLMTQEKDTIYFLISGLKRLRNFIGQIGKTPVHIIKSGQNFTAIKLFEEFLSTEISGDEVLICDSYVSPETLFPLASLKGKVNKIKLLTSNVFDSDKFKDYLKRMEKENIKVEVKVNKKLHDRYLISNNRCWSIGGSIKDLGNKDIVIKDISEVFDSMANLFLERWSEQ